MVTQYIQSPDPSGIFIGIGAMVLFFAFAFMIYQVFIRPTKQNNDLEQEYVDTERVAIHKYVGKKGINLVQEIDKINIFKTGRFRKELEKQVLEDFFGKNKPEAKPATAPKK